MARRRSCSSVARSSVSARISGSNRTNLRTGSTLARWRAISASLSRSPGVGHGRPADGEPDAGADDDLLAVEVERDGRPRPSTRAATRSASRTLRTGPSSTPNSSLPSRATTSVLRAVATSRRATSARSRSPAAWPRLSLTTLNRSRSSRMSATRERGLRAAIRRVRVELLGEPVEQQRPVRQAGQHVVEGGVGALPALGLRPLEQAGVVERDRRELREPRQRLELALGERPRPVARGEPDEAQHLAVRGQRHGAHGAERGGIEPAGRRRVRAVVVDVHRPPGPDHRPADARAGREVVAVEVVEQPDADAADEVDVRAVVLEQVQEPVLHADQAGRAVHDLAQQLRGLEALEEPQRHLVDGGEVRVAGRVVDAEPQAVGGLGEIERAVGDGDQLVLLAGVVGVERRAGADRDERARTLGQSRDGGPDPVGDLADGAARDPGQQDRELVAAVAVDAVAVAQRVGHRERDPAQQRVALGMAVPVVVGLERVEVEHQQAERLLALDQQPELALEGAVVAQPGQRVVLGLGHDRAVRLGVPQRDRGLAREQLDELELVLREVRLAARPCGRR